MKDYYRLQKFNVIELSNSKNEDISAAGTHRVGGKTDKSNDGLDESEKPPASDEVTS